MSSADEPPAAAAGAAPATLASAAAFGEPLFSSILKACSSVRRLAEVPHAPASWSETQAAVAAREEEKRKREAQRKEAAKSTCGLLPSPPPQHPPGSTIGPVADASAFWMFVVRRGRVARGPVRAGLNAMHFIVCTLHLRCAGGLLS